MKSAAHFFACVLVSILSLQTVRAATNVPVSLPPVATPDIAIVTKNAVAASINVLQNDLGVGLVVTAVTQGSHGTVAIVTSTSGPTVLTGVTYTPTKDYVGPDSFTYTITDVNKATAVGAVSVTVLGLPPPPPTPAPVANPDTAKVPKNSAGVAIAVLLNDIGTGLTITSATQGAHGVTTIIAAVAGTPTALASINYVPAADYVGPDAFDYTITDANSATATGHVIVLVADTTPPPPPPPPPSTLKANDDHARVLKNSLPVPINVLANDVGSGLKITAITQGAHGTVAIISTTAAAATPSSAGVAVTYAPATDYVGNDTFTYTISDSSGATATANVGVEVIDVLPPPPPPPPPPGVVVAVPDFAKVAKNSAANVINVLANDIGKGLKVTASTQGTHGAVALALDGSNLTYAPATDYAGPDTFTYTITDASGTKATGPVMVYVDGGPSGPHCNPDFATTQKNSAGVDINVLANDIGDHLSIASFTQAQNGVVTLSATGNTLTYVPNKDFSGLDKFSYTAVDAKGLTGVGNVGVNVIGGKPSQVLAHASPPIVPPGGSVAFFCDVLLDPTLSPTAFTFSWDFGDGSAKSTERNPTHTYAAEGTYTATVSVSNGGKSIGSSSVTVVVKSDTQGPRALFTLSFPVAFAGSPITFDATGSKDTANAIASYAWDFGDGSVDNLSIETHTYAAAGEYKVSLTVTNDKGQSSNFTRPVQVLAQGSSFKSRVHYSAKLNFATAGTDGLVLDALLNIGSANVAAGSTVSVSVAGVTFKGTLDTGLKDTSSASQRFNVKAGPTGSGTAALHFQVKNATLAKAFSDAGAVPPATPGAVTVSIPVDITLDTADVSLTIDSLVGFNKGATKASVVGDTNKVSKKAVR